MPADELKAMRPLFMRSVPKSEYTIRVRKHGSTVYEALDTSFDELDVALMAARQMCDYYGCDTAMVYGSRPYDHLIRVLRHDD